jgi:polar amino acid transport system substrate-binding protein
MAAMISHSLGVGLRTVRQEWPDLMPSLVEGKTDIVISAMTITPKRNLSVMFTRPVLETGRMFLVHKKFSGSFARFKDLNKPGAFVVSRFGGLGSIRLQEELPLAASREFKDQASALNEVIEGRAHAYIDDEFVIRLACAKNPDTLIGRFKAVTYEPMALAVRPGDIHWLNWLNNFIRSIQRDGRLDELKKKWLRDYFLDLGAPTR